MSQEKGNLNSDPDSSLTEKEHSSVTENSIANTCNENEEVNLHIWTLLRGAQNRCSIFGAYRVKLAALGDNHIIFTTYDDAVFSLGENRYGQLGLGDTEPRAAPREVNGLGGKQILRVVCGARHTGVVCKNGQVFCWGDSRQGQCGVGERGLFTTPCRVQFVESTSGNSAKIQELALGGIHSLAIDYRGILWAFGTGVAMGLGTDVMEALVPTKVKALLKKRAVAISAGEWHSLAIMQEEFHGTHLPQLFDSASDSSGPVGEASNSYNKHEATAIPFLKSEFYSIQDSGNGMDGAAGSPDQCSGSSISTATNLSRSVPGTPSQYQSSDCTDNQSQRSHSYTILENQSSSRDLSARKSFDNRLFNTDTNDKEIESQHLAKRHSFSAMSFSNRLYNMEQESPPGASQVEDLFDTSCSTIGASTPDVSGEKTGNNGKPGFNSYRYNSLGVPGRNQTSPDTLGVGSNNLDVSTVDIFKSALDIFTTDGSTSENSPGDLKDKQLTAQSSATETSVVDQDSSTKRDILVAASSSEPNLESEQAKRERLFTLKLPHEKRYRTGSAWSLLSGANSIESKSSSITISGNTEVWTWGKNTYGQLGTGDTKDSSIPMNIKKLSRKGIVNIAAGAYHSIALTNYCQVYSWGDNSFLQSGHKGLLNTVPKRVKSLCDVRVWDIAAGKSLSLFLGDNCESDSSDVYFCGSQDRKLERTSSIPSQDSSGGMTPPERKKNEKKWKKLSARGKRNSEGTLSPSQNSSDVKKIVHFRTDILFRAVDANYCQFSCLTERTSVSHLSALYKFARSERTYFCQLAMIQFVVVEPLRQSDQWTTSSKLPGGEALLRMVDSFDDLLHNVGSGLHQLTQVVQNGRTAKDLFSFLLSDSFRGSYDRFSVAYCDALAIGQIHSCNKVVSSIVAKSRDAMKKALSDHQLPSLDLEHLLKIPLTRHKQYQDALEENIQSMERSELYTAADVAQVQEVQSRWHLFQESNVIRLEEAENTRLYWDECPSKLMEALKEPQRRLLKTSKADPLTLARALRLSTHSYVLFNDVFVHIQFNRNFQVFPLVTMWAEPDKDTDSNQHTFRILAPEQSFVLSAGSKPGKISWLCEINKAIANCLSVSSSHCIDITAVNMNTGTLQAAVAREAWYTFVNHSRYKGARYTGMWLLGQPHGRGRLEWPDGTYYEGEFVKGNFHGFGVMVYASINGAETEKRYEGEWVEGKMRGFGKMNYANKEEYLGQWYENVRQGHGTLKQSSTSDSLQTVYVGDWMNDQKHGYGVLDLILKGEKYMGMWASDQRHGQGIVVTVDGVYYEGKFVQNKLVGKGVLLSDDDTCYEGEFTADMLLNGKGLLTFQNGDYIDGTFSGKWGDGIKVNGTFFKFANPDPVILGETNSFHGKQSEFTVPAESKWKSLFQECKGTMGYDGVYEPNEYVVWAAVQQAIIKAQALGSLKGYALQDTVAQELLTHGGKVENRAKLVQDLKSLQGYLERAFNMFGHPLNTLVDSLVEVYRTTYVGVGAHRRLLPQAVAEAKSYVTRLFAVIRLLFPDLHDEELVLLTNSNASGVVDVPIDSSSLLHPILLPRLYPTLFTLYALHTEKGDALYAERLHQLNKRNDQALMSFLGVSRKFWLIPKDAEDNSSTGAAVSPYQTAVDTLLKISTSYSPMEKIGVLRRCFAKVHDEVDGFWCGENKIGCMDDLFPVFQYVVIRARIPHMGSEIQFIEDLVEPSVLVGEAGHMVTTLKACYFQIQHEKDRE